MTRTKKPVLYSLLLLIGLTAFILEIFVFKKPDGVLGLIICIVSIFLVFGSVIKLCRLSPKFENSFLSFLDVLFWLP